MWIFYVSFRWRINTIVTLKHFLSKNGQVLLVYCRQGHFGRNSQLSNWSAVIERYSPTTDSSTEETDEFYANWDVALGIIGVSCLFSSVVKLQVAHFNASSSTTCRHFPNCLLSSFAFYPTFTDSRQVALRLLRTENLNLLHFSAM